MADPLTGLVRTLDRACAQGVRVMESHSTPWSSVTFVGGRHWLLLALTQDDAAQLIQDIEEMEFAIAGHLVADLKMTALTRRGEEATMTIEVLTVEVDQAHSV